MQFDILKMEDTEDGGAIVTVEVDRDILLIAFEYWLNNALREKIEEINSETEARTVAEEERVTSDPGEVVESERKTVNMGTDSEPVWVTYTENTSYSPKTRW